jgi:hypothetical protein
MTYLIHDEQLLDMEGYLEKLREYMDFYKITFLEGDLLQKEVPAPK